MIFATYFLLDIGNNQYIKYKVIDMDFEKMTATLEQFEGDKQITLPIDTLLKIGIFPKNI
jgi:hypothetical protein